MHVWSWCWPGVAPPEALALRTSAYGSSICVQRKRKSGRGVGGVLVCPARLDSYLEFLASTSKGTGRYKHEVENVKTSQLNAQIIAELQGAQAGPHR